MAEEPESSRFKVSDRRRFSPEGEPLERGDEPETAETPSAEAPPPREESAAEPGDPSRFSHQPHTVPPAKFEILVISLAMQAELELGMHGASQEQPPNLEMAQHTIDLLGVLQEKTRGNLSFEEQRLLENTLTELRFRYVQAVEEVNQKARQGS